MFGHHYKMRSSIAALLLSSLLSLSAAMAQDGEGSEATAPGYYALTLPDAGRRYTLVIPDGYTGQEAAPLVISLHYGGGVTPFYGRGLLESLIEPALRDLGAILVAPDSAAGDWANSLAQQHVLELMDHVEARYNIDSERTLLTGYSMGGRGTWYLAARHPDRFKAALPIAGQPPPDSATVDWTIPLYVIHSAVDQVLSLEPNLAIVEQLGAEGVDIEFTVVSDLGHYEIPRYRPYVEGAIPWIRGVWESGRDE